MKVIFPQPTAEQFTNFIIENNAISHVSVMPSDVEQTRNKTGFSPFVAGHLSAMKFGIDSCVKEPNWPADHPVQWESVQRVAGGLLWLRTLHEKLCTPIAKYADRLADLEPISLADCGRYRITAKTVGLGRPLPKPTAIPALLHLWFTELGKYHISIRDSLRRPSNKQVLEASTKAYKLHIKLCCIAPFTKGNGVTARLVENLLRLRWGLPWRVQHAKFGAAYAQEIMQFEDSAEWQATLKSVNAIESPRSAR